MQVFTAAMDGGMMAVRRVLHRDMWETGGGQTTKSQVREKRPTLPLLIVHSSIKYDKKKLSTLIYQNQYH